MYTENKMGLPFQADIVCFCFTKEGTERSKDLPKDTKQPRDGVGSAIQALHEADYAVVGFFYF